MNKKTINIENLLREIQIRFDTNPRCYTKQDFQLLVALLTYFVESDWPIPEKIQDEIDALTEQVEQMATDIEELKEYPTDEEIDLIFEEEDE